MADTLISTLRLYVNGGGASGYGHVDPPTAAQIAVAQDAVNMLSVDPDTQCNARVDFYFVPLQFFVDNHWSAAGDDPIGYSPTRGKKFIRTGLTAKTTKYAILHEFAHTIDDDKLDGATRLTLAALMTPAVDTSVKGWWGKGYRAAPNECFADTYPRAFANLTDVLVGSQYPGGMYYQRKIPSTSYAAYRTAVGGSGGPAATTFAANAVIGATNIKVASVAGLSGGDWVKLNDTAKYEIDTVGTSGSGGTGLTLTTALAEAYTTGQSVVETSPPSDPVSGEIVKRIVTDTANGATASYRFTGLPIGATGTCRMRFFDGSEWGPWCDDVVVQLTVMQGPPTRVTVTPGTLTPDIGASLNSPDPTDAITGYLLRIWQQVAGGNILKMDVDENIAPVSNRVVIAYQGNVGGPLAWDQPYVGFIYLRNKSNLTSPYTAFYFTPTVDVGPVITPHDPSVKLDTTTPTYTLADRNGADIDEARLRLWDSTGTALLWDSGAGGISPFTPAASHDITVDADVLSLGVNFLVDGAVRRDGDTDIGSYGTKFAQHVNAAPGAPTPVTLPGDTNEQVVQRDDGVWVTTSSRPSVKFPFVDTDRDQGYDEYPTLRDYEIRTDANALIARLVRKMFALDELVETTTATIVSFAQPGDLDPDDAGWVAGSNAVLLYTADGASLLVRLTALPTATTSTQTLADGLHEDTLYTDLSGVVTATIVVRAYSGPGLPSGLTVKLRFTFSGDPANYAEFDLTPSTNNAYEQKTLTLASPAATGGVVNWAEVSGIEARVRHTAGVNRSIDVYLRNLSITYATSEAITKHRARYADSAGVLSAYSEYAQIKFSAAPTLTDVTPADGSEVTDPTPTWDGVFTVGPGKTDAGYSFTASIGGAAIYTDSADSGWPTIPVGILDTDQDVDWELFRYDSDGLYAQEIGSFTTSFTVPDAPTDLSVSTDLDTDSLLVSWARSPMPENEYIATYVYYKTASNQWERIPAISDQDQTYTLLRVAPHNVETLVRVTFSNGWAESDPAEGSGEIGGPRDSADFIHGYWLVRDDRIIELPTARTEMPGKTEHGTGDTQTDTEVFAPPGSPYKVLLNWGTTGYEGSVALFTQDRELVDQLRSWKEQGLVSILKTPYGTSRYVQLLSTPDTDRAGWWIDAAFTFIEVDPATVNF